MKRPTLTPLMKLAILAIQANNNSPHTLSDLSEVTGGSPFSMQRLARKMVNRGILTRNKDGQTSCFVLVDPLMKVVQ